MTGANKGWQDISSAPDGTGLLPCPFCGDELSEPSDVQQPRSGLARFHPGAVTDDNCPIAGWGFYNHQLEAWNTRATPPGTEPSDDDLVEALEVVDLYWNAVDIMLDGPDDSDKAMASAKLVEAHRRAKAIRATLSLRRGGGQ